MGKAVVPRKQGDDYQARFFWIQACRLFEPLTRVVRVGFEVEDAKGFDDVVVFYDPAIQDEFGQPVVADYYQLKFHTNYAGAFTWKALMDPAFIGAESTSLLQRLAAIQKTFPPERAGRRFFIATPWPVHPEDSLAKLVSGHGGQLKLDVLTQGGSTSLMGKIRSAWGKHLGVASDQELFSILGPLRIQPGHPNLETTRNWLNAALRAAGLMPVPDDRLGHPYDELIRKLHGQGHTVFTRENIQQVCQREGLWCGGPRARDTAVQLGVRSFMPWAEYLEDKTDRMLCLVRHFDGRLIRSPELWHDAVFPELNNFLRESVTGPGPYHLFLETHTSIAFAAGYALGSKSGADIAVVQSTRNGKIVWHPARHQHQQAASLWSFQEVPCRVDLPDVALAVSASWDLLDDVRAYVDRAQPAVGRIIAAHVLPEPGARAVHDGPHAMMLAEALASHARQHRSRPEREGTLHLFIAAPNAFMFFLGQLAHGLGRCVLYEFAFDHGAPRDYQPSLTFPVPTTGK